MALTRKMLKAMGIEDEKIDQIIEAHTETTDALKQQRDEAKAEAADAEKLREQLKAAQEAAGDPDEYKAKFEAEKKAFADFKAEVEAKRAQDEARSLFKAQVEALGITGSRADAVVRATDLKAFEVADGAYKDPEKVKKAIQDEWADFIPKTTTEGASVAHPPATGGSAVTAEQFAKMTLRERNSLYQTDRATYDALANPQDQGA